MKLTVKRFQDPWPTDLTDSYLEMQIIWSSNTLFLAVVLKVKDPYLRRPDKNGNFRANQGKSRDRISQFAFLEVLQVILRQTQV